MYYVVDVDKSVSVRQLYATKYCRTKLRLFSRIQRLRQWRVGNKQYNLQSGPPQKDQQNYFE